MFPSLNSLAAPPHNYIYTHIRKPSQGLKNSHYLHQTILNFLFKNAINHTSLLPKKMPLTMKCVLSERLFFMSLFVYWKSELQKEGETATHLLSAVFFPSHCQKWWGCTRLKSGASFGVKGYSTWTIFCYFPEWLESNWISSGVAKSQAIGDAGFASCSFTGYTSMPGPRVFILN